MGTLLMSLYNNIMSGITGVLAASPALSGYEVNRQNYADGIDPNSVADIIIKHVGETIKLETLYANNAITGGTYSRAEDVDIQIDIRTRRDQARTKPDDIYDVMLPVLHRKELNIAGTQQSLLLAGSYEEKTNGTFQMLESKWRCQVWRNLTTP